MNIAIAGPGLMGSQIGVEYALGGHHVALVARSVDRGIDRVNAAFETASTLGVWLEDEVAAAHDRVAFVPEITDLNTGTDVFVESIIEDSEAKIALMKEAAEHLPEAIIASNTSSLSIGRLGGWAGASKRTLGTHYWNPPLLMPLVEVVPGPETDPEITQQMVLLLQSLGKRPVTVNHDIDGFVWNRLQLALLREAVWLVERGVASPEVVDEIVRDGLARRWKLTGPFETAALGGADTFTRIARNLWPELSHASEVEHLEKWLIDDPTELDAIRTRRDAGLLEEMIADREADARRTEQG